MLVKLNYFNLALVVFLLAEIVNFYEVLFAFCYTVFCQFQQTVDILLFSNQVQLSSLPEVQGHSDTTEIIKILS